MIYKLSLIAKISVKIIIDFHTFLMSIVFKNSEMTLMIIERYFRVKDIY